MYKQKGKINKILKWNRGITFDIGGREGRNRKGYASTKDPTGLDINKDNRCLGLVSHSLTVTPAQ